MTSSFLAGFEGLWRRSTVDYRKGVKSYLIVVDTNVLLELYRFTPDARKELLDVLERLGDRLWIPHQVAAEYYTRRIDAIKDHIALYTSVPKALMEQKNKTLQELHTFAKRCSISVEDKEKLLNPIESAYTQALAEIERHGEIFDLSLEKVISADPVLTALASLLDGKTGQSFSDAEAEDLVKNFEKRVAAKIPPGYRDSGKKENSHGDYFLWEQVLREVESRQKPVLLVTNDAKEDWVRKESGFIVGARPELVREMQERCGVDFLITQLGAFLKTAKEELGASVSPSTVAQAENIRRVAPNVESVRVSLKSSEFDDLYAALSHEVEQCVATHRLLSSLDPDERGFEYTKDLELAEWRTKKAEYLLSVLERGGRPTLDGEVVLTCSRRNWSSLQAVANRVRNKKSSHILDEADRLEDQLNHERQALEEDYAQLIEERARVRTHEEKLRALLDQEPEGEDGANLGRDQIHRRLEESRQRVLALDLRAKRIRNILQATSDEDS